MPRGGRTVSSSNRDRFDLDGAAPKVWEAINARRGRKIPGLAKVGATPIPLFFTLMVGFDGAEVKDGPVAPNADIATTSVGSGSRAW